MFIEQNELSPEDVESLRKPSQCLRLKKKKQRKKASMIFNWTTAIKKKQSCFIHVLIFYLFVI